MNPSSPSLAEDLQVDGRGRELGSADPGKPRTRLKNPRRLRTGRGTETAAGANGHYPL